MNQQQQILQAISDQSDDCIIEIQTQIAQLTRLLNEKIKVTRFIALLITFFAPYVQVNWVHHHF
jgi:hypothetical protein